MRSVPFALAALLLCAAPLLADDPGAAQLTDLLSKGAGKVFAVPASDEATAPIVGLFGELGSGSLSDAEGTAKTFVKSYGKILGFPDGDSLGGNVKKLREWSGGDDGKFLAYTLTDGGYAYLPSMVVFGFRSDGKLVAATGRMKPLSGARIAALSDQELLSKAQQAIAEKFPEVKDASKLTGDGKAAEYLIDAFTADHGVDRVVSLALTTGSPPIPHHVVMVASSGFVIEVTDGRLLENSAHVYELDPSGFSTPALDLPDLIYPGFWPKWTINGKHFKVDPTLKPGTPRAKAWTGWFDDDPNTPTWPNPPFAEEMVYRHLHVSREKAVSWGAGKDLDQHDPLYFNHFQEVRCDNITDSKQKDACVANETDNAWYNPADPSLHFASKKVKAAGSPAYDATIISHEFGHFVHCMCNEHFRLGGGIYDWLEAGGVAEGFGDLFSASVTGHSVIAKWFAGAISNGPFDVDMSRDVEKPMKRSDMKRYWERAFNAGGVPDAHEIGKLYASAVWKLRTSSTLSGDETIKRAIAGLRMSLLPSTFTNAALGLVAADQMMSSSPHTSGILKVFQDYELLPAPRGGGS